MTIPDAQYDLSDWTWTDDDGFVRVIGHSSGHPFFEDGVVLASSPVLRVVRDATDNEARVLAVTRKGVYRLETNPTREAELFRRLMSEG